MIFIHVLIAVSSLFLSIFTYFSPTSLKLKLSYALITSTLVSGTYLVASTHTNILRTCVSGLLFLTVTSVITFYTRQKISNTSI